MTRSIPDQTHSLTDSDVPTAAKARPAPRCAACGGETREGFLTPVPGNPIWWRRGRLDGAIWKRILGFYYSAERNPLLVSAFRCDHCGRLEFYANE